MRPERKLLISIILIWLFNVSGIIGILIGYKDWFLALTPLNLLVYLGLILWNSTKRKSLIIGLLIPFTMGMITEYLGVNYGLIFGQYQYGDNLGTKMLGVPWIIGVNWALLVYCTGAISKKIHTNVIVASFIGAILMVALDVIIEVSAPRFDFWEFKNGVVPLQNYVGWFVIAFIAHLLFQKVIKTLQYMVSIHIFIAIFIFFTTFLFF
ncbi:carotenoid biosynthesis protein [Aquimarina sp. 2201CG14-23]|uniref:carotenoid biosynthesis protein n=1 Tax=Aquimarina mycalae TaxID=3040073 RepID=UPI002477E293|nr:carotenoid biosynthesis protein [Aquimarina sp. 2201CG14-23]MDH7447425.1 carotenoid biosynthesis protein [Aquimarina sp. 2201CG14-23]